MSKNLWFYDTRKTTTDKCIVLDFDELQAHTYIDDLSFESLLNDEKTIEWRKHMYLIDYPEMEYDGECKAWGVLRPGFFEFIDFCFEHFKIVAVWSAGLHDYVHSVVESVWYTKHAPHVVFTRRECQDQCETCGSFEIEAFSDIRLLDDEGRIMEHKYCMECKSQCKHCHEMVLNDIVEELLREVENDEKTCSCKKYEVINSAKPLSKFWDHPVWGKYMRPENTIIIDDKFTICMKCNPTNGIMVPAFTPNMSGLFPHKETADIKEEKVKEEKISQFCNDCNFQTLIEFFKSTKFIECEDVRKLNKDIFEESLYEKDTDTQFYLKEYKKLYEK